MTPVKKNQRTFKRSFYNSHFTVLVKIVVIDAAKCTCAKVTRKEGKCQERKINSNMPYKTCAP